MFLKRIVITALVVVAAGAPAPAAFAMFDFAPESSVRQDLRGPDARPAPPVHQGLRSPDARDAPLDLVAPETPPAGAPVGHTVEVSGAESRGSRSASPRPWRSRSSPSALPRCGAAVWPPPKGLS